MIRRQKLQIPGPTNIPSQITRALSQPLINHRGPEFERLLSSLKDGLKKVLYTDNDILLFPSSGSGAIESAIVNVFSPGDSVLVICQGVFSERVALISDKFGLNVIRLEIEWGKAVNPNMIISELNKDKNQKIKAVFLPQNETTTAIVNDIELIGRKMKDSGHPALLIVDAISSIACMPFKQDEWNVDVAISASQKGLMLPPGLSIISLNENAWQAVRESKMPRWYWDYESLYKKNLEGQMPYTPPTALFLGLEESLSMIEKEGLSHIWERHAMIAEAVRESIKEMGLFIFSEQGSESNSLTAFCVPEGLTYKDIAEALRLKYDIVIGGGLQKLKGKIVRIGHMGDIQIPDIFGIMCSLELTLIELGYRVKPGTAARAITNSLINRNFTD